MPSTLSTAWVKNVYNLGIQYGITRGLLSTPTRGQSLNPQLRAYKPSFIPQLIPDVYPLSSTAIFPPFNLLIHLLSTVSTAPTIKKKKEKERK